MIIHIPHASGHIPDAVRKPFVLDDAALADEQLRLTDEYTDELFDLPQARTICFPLSRLAVDVERFPDDEQEPMSRVGMGRFYMKTADGRALRRALTAEEYRLLAGYYAAHHQRLAEAVEEELNEKGRSLIIDGHSFPGTPLPCDQNQSIPRPDICIGTDDFHTPDDLIQSVFQCLENEGFSLAVNRPYSGTLVPLKFYRKDPRVSSIMIEVNRRLYMNEQTGARNDHFDRIQTLIRNLLSRLYGWKG